MSGDLVTKLASIVIDGRRTMEEVALSVASAMDGSGDLSELSGLLSDGELLQLQGGPTGFAVHCCRLQPVYRFTVYTTPLINANDQFTTLCAERVATSAGVRA